MPEKLIKSRKRVREFAEVFTPDFIVRDMCDLVPREIWENIDSTFLEPACGTWNFCAEILHRKLALAKTEDEVLRCYRSIYGIDIQGDNVEETRERLFLMAPAFLSLSARDAVKRVLDSNFQCGDGLEWMKMLEDEKG